MKNVLSFYKRAVSGKDINEWIEYHTNNQTGHSRIARYFKRHYHIVDSRQYVIISQYDELWPYKKNKPPMIYRFDKHDWSYYFKTP